MTEETIFAAAVEKGTPTERAAYLDCACGDNVELRRSVEALLASHDAQSNVLDRPLVEMTATIGSPAQADANLVEGPGAQIGRYKLMEQIGEGGFGLVFVAEQQQPVRRKVALKVIKPGMDTRDVIARFEAERQALALMDHPNIARVLDAGATPSGRPFFVMELVRGVTISNYCDQNQLTPRERLELFVSVCHAVQHAHQKGIIHRDLKPSNVLVTLHDSRPVVKVIDFGVAKALNQRLTENTVYTRFAEMIGTPLYMSPEQAEMSGLDIDTRSDIYSLGVLLYELMTGTTPFDRKRLAAAALDEVRRIIREEEPPKPSMRLSQSADSLPSIAAQRKTEPAQLSKLLRGDVDWIVMKCLEKDRTRRYETANGLGRDIQRYLADEPVEACPPSAGYRLRKLLRKHKKSLGVAAIFAILLTSAAIVSGWQAVRATRAEQQARDDAEAARQARDAETRQRALSDQRRMEAETAKEAEVKHRERAERHRAEAQNALTSAETNLYFHRIALAERYWFANNVARTEQFLESCSPSLRRWEWHYLKRLCHPELMTLRGNCLAYSPDGRRLATSVKDPAGNREVITLWDAHAGKELATFGHVAHGIYSLAFSPDGKRLAGACADRVVRVWEVSSGNELLSIKGHVGPFVTQVAFSPDGTRLASAGAAPNNFRGGLQPDEVCVWDASNGNELHRFKEAGLSVAFSPDGKQFASYSLHRVGPTAAYLLRVWETVTGKVLFTHSFLSGENDSRGTIVYSPDGKLIVTAQYDKIKLWDAKTGEEVRVLSGQAAVFAFSPDSAQIASGGHDETIRVWDVNTGQERRIYRGHQGPVNNLAFSPKDHLLASAGHDQTVRIWDTRQPQGARELPGIPKSARAVALSPDHKTVASISSEGLFWDSVSLSDARTGKFIRSLDKSIALPGARRDSLKFFPDGRRLAVARLAGVVEIWDTTSGRTTARLAGRADRIHCLEFSVNGQLMATYGRPQATFARDGIHYPDKGQDGTVRLWDVATGKQFSSLTIKRMIVKALSFSPDGTRLAVVGVGAPKGDLVQPGIAQVWDIASGEVALRLGGADGSAHRLPVADVAFSPDGRRLATASWSETVKIWDAADGKELFRLRGHSSYIEGITFSPDGHRLASVGIDRLVKLWDVSTGYEVLTLEVSQYGPKIAFSDDGCQLVVKGNDELVVWDATPMTAP